MNGVREANTTFLLLSWILFWCLGAGSMATLAGGGREASYHRTHSSVHARLIYTFVRQGLYHEQQTLHSEPQGHYLEAQGLHLEPQGLYVKPKGMHFESQGLHFESQGAVF